MPIRLGISASVGVAALTLLTASRAVAHIDLLEPEARAHGTAARDDTDIDENSNLKQAPCGQIVTGRSARVATYAAGETIRVRVREENAHVSYLRVSIDLDGEDFPLRQPAARDPETQEEAAAAEAALGGDGLLAVYREDNDTPGFVHELEVTLPQAACTSCTLQVLQYMYDDPAAPYYFQCADLVIVGADGAEDAGAVGSDDGPAPSPSAGNGGAPSLGAANPVTDPIATGSVATGDSASPAGATPAATGATPAANGGPNVVTPGPSSAGPAAGGDSDGCSLSRAAGRPDHQTGWALLTLGLACARRRLRRRISLRRA
jgi:hypothetical protein